MSEAWIKVYVDGNLTCTVPLDRAFELGRQQSSQEALYSPRYIEAEGRLVVASESKVKIPRRLLRIQPLPNGFVRITNIHDTTVVSTEGGPSLRPRASIDTRPGCLLTLGHGVAVRLEEPMELSAVGTPSLTPTMAAEAFRNGRLESDAPDPAKLIQWFQAVIFILQSATTAADLFRHSVDALVRLVGLDNGAVVLWDANSSAWRIVERQGATGARNGDDEWMPSQQMLFATRAKQEVLYHVPKEVNLTSSLEKVSGVVAAPILDESGVVLGVVYGDRHTNLPGRPQVSPLDAQLVQTIACAVATGLVRFEKEQRIVAEQAKFEQFFTVELARSLAADPRLLEGRDADITCLFCDIRGFSRVSERLGAQKVMEWIGAVMDVLSDCVAAEKGVLIDYIGDELFAMWGAPDVQADHASRACAAGRAMLNCLPRLNSEWRSRLGCEFGVGIGVHTGKAFVGNTGSQRKFKYGPLGNTVNLASRVQGATKYLRSNLLVTEHTRRRLEQCEDFRRLCKIRVVNIEEPIELFDLPIAADSSWQRLKASYESALAAFEAHEYQAATRRILDCLDIAPNDGPSMLLLSRAVTAIGDGSHDEAWVLPGK